MADALQAAMNTNLLNASGVYVDGLESNGTQSAHASQHANAFPLSLGIVPAAQETNVIAQVESLGMSVSALGILQLVRALGEADQGPQLLDLYTNASQYGWARCLSLQARPPPGSRGPPTPTVAASRTVGAPSAWRVMCVIFWVSKPSRLNSRRCRLSRSTSATASPPPAARC